MKYQTLISQNVSALTQTLTKLTEVDLETVEKIATRAAKSLHMGGTIFWCGNGGSAADAQHLAAELIGRLVNNRRPLSSLSLNSDVAALTCISNDFGYPELFSRQLEGLATAGDVVIALTTSGMSDNILRCLRKSKQLSITSVALLGKGGGDAKSMADYEIVVDSDNTARIQEVHKFLGHTICQIIERELGFQN